MEKVGIAQVEIGKEIYFKISNSHLMRPFFMSIVSNSDHWMFISSNGGLTAGRKNAEQALFPYYTDDKITESNEITGSKTIIRVEKGGVAVWEPFSIRSQGTFRIQRNLYKNKYGNRIIFEEVNEDLKLKFSYEWSSSYKYGFVRKSQLVNLAKEPVIVSILDGIQNVLPHGVPSDLQNSTSNLVDAYKRTELHTESGLGIFALSAIIVDKAEPSEALKANVVWSTGLKNPKHLLSALQLNNFRKHAEVSQEVDIKGEKGAYFVQDTFQLAENDAKEWTIVANTNQSHSKLTLLIQEIIHGPNILDNVLADVEKGTKNLILLNASADGIQCTANTLKDTRHFANVLFNNMRGGIFDSGYTLQKKDFENHIFKANQEVYHTNTQLWRQLDDNFELHELKEILATVKDPDVVRLATEYLPLKFSRRHGDPSRPWNKFSINMVNEVDGSKVLDYEGNWRDIFQNWEAMVHSFPDFIEGMIFRFLNASTFDGYNPYRITKDGYDWETIEPDDPWSYIGYWGDHQIIYLLKFLEFSQRYHPRQLVDLFDKEVFVYANVPYKIKSYADILKNPKDTIEFDEKADEEISAAIQSNGADQCLLKDGQGQTHHVNFIEKILATLLAKLSNYIPQGGIWMNTQRPEWNDANNALVGNGISMVTLYYMRRFTSFLNTILNESDLENFKTSEELCDFYRKMELVFNAHTDLSKLDFNPKERRNMMDQLGQAASDYRLSIYENSFSGKRKNISKKELQKFLSNTLLHIDNCIVHNERSDGLYHAYNLLTISEDEAQVSNLSEMLEGQVAVLSSGFLTPLEALNVLDALKNSALFRSDQYSYMLYPNKQLPGFLEKNIIPDSVSNSSALIAQLEKDGNTGIIERDVLGKLHFNGNFRNVTDVLKELRKLDDVRYGNLVEQESELMAEIFESVFNHKAFTGRSGTFYGYEGLGSIYWHMVSKLLLAVQEYCIKAKALNVEASVLGRLLEHFYEINEGIGVHKSPELYGAFPTDPYSHTPAHRGAQQPGMTGQVKEDILSRIGELGLSVQSGKIAFNPSLLRGDEFNQKAKSFLFMDLVGKEQKIALNPGSLAFTYCQVPIVYELSEQQHLVILLKDGGRIKKDTLQLNRLQSLEVFKRTGTIKSIVVYMNKEILK